MLLDTGGNALSETTTMNYDADLNATANNYHDYIPIDPFLAQTGAISSIPQGALLKTQESTYLVNDLDIAQSIRDGYRSRNLIPLVTKSIVKDGSGRIVSAAQNKYDESAYPLTTYPAVINWADPQTSYRGNITTSRIWVSNDSGSPSAWGGWNAGNWITTHSWYDQCGNVVRKKDGRGGESTFSYSDNFATVGTQNSYAYLTSASNALTHTTTSKYDYNTGLVVEAVDVNGTITRNEYSDPLGRPTRVISAYGTSVQSQQSIQYEDANKRMSTTSDLSVYGDNKLRSEVIYDGLGRAVESRKYENATSYVRSFTEYDVMGRLHRSSNLHRPGDSIMWTTTSYDSLGRVVAVVTPDGARISTQYSGNQVTVTDQAGKMRRSLTDVFNRVIKVTEAPGTLNYETTYFYDSLDNLRHVNKGGQSRWFSYNSLSQLIRARNPEQNCNPNLPPHTDPLTGGACWSMAYSYDANGNLTQRIDARGVVTNHSYDALNRTTKIDYINGSQTKSVETVYDGAVNGKGQFFFHWTVEVGIPASRDSIERYDAMGRPMVKWQHFWRGSDWGTPYVTEQSYDLAGAVKSLTYPSGHSVNYSHDQAGQLSSFSGNLGGGAVVNYADTISYNAAGQTIKERFVTNTPLYRNNHYNSRLQLVDIRVGDSATDIWNGNRGAFAFFYGTTAVTSGNQFANDTDNNGNLRRQITHVPLAGGGGVIPQMHDYYYDPLNRIAAVRERQSNQSGQWSDSVSQAYSYDQWGNRTLDLSGGSGEETVWFDDELPAGAVPAGYGGDGWNWVSSSPAPQSGSVSHISNLADWSNWSPPPYSGNVSHQSNISSGFHQHQYFSSPAPIPVRSGGTLYAHIYIDPENSVDELES